MYGYNNKETKIAAKDFIAKNHLENLTYKMINGLKEWNIQYSDIYRVTYLYSPKTEQFEIYEEYLNDDSHNWERLRLLTFHEALKMRAA